MSESPQESNNSDATIDSDYLDKLLEEEMYNPLEEKMTAQIEAQLEARLEAEIAGNPNQRRSYSRRSLN